VRLHYCHMVFLGERVGFEPTKRSSRFAVFKTAAFNHSATSPRLANPDFMRIFRNSSKVSGPSRDELGTFGNVTPLALHREERPG
jgi:hypothetical protein